MILLEVYIPREIVHRLSLRLSEGKLRKSQPVSVQSHTTHSIDALRVFNL
jgi:hypothetical protein